MCYMDFSGNVTVGQTTNGLDHGDPVIISQTPNGCKSGYINLTSTEKESKFCLQIVNNG